MLAQASIPCRKISGCWCMDPLACARVTFSAFGLRGVFVARLVGADVGRGAVFRAIRLADCNRAAAEAEVFVLGIADRPPAGRRRQVSQSEYLDRFFFR